MLALGLAAVGLTGWVSSASATAALRQATFERLTGLRESKRRQIEDYFQQLSSHVTALSADESTVTALEELKTAWLALPQGTDRSVAGPLARIYQDELGDGREQPSTWYPDDARQTLLQQWFIATNPFSREDRDQLLEPDRSGAYGAVHARYHPTLQRYMTAFGFYDILLVDAETTRVLYSVLKEVDLGAPLGRPPHSATGLASAFARASALDWPGAVVVQDYAPYPPSSNAPAAFVAAPIWRAGARIGALVIQVSVDDVNRVMTSGRNWQNEGLGRTGQTYIAGPDGRLRSDARFEMEHFEAYLAQLSSSGVDAETVDRIRKYETGVLAAPVSAEVRELMEAGATGTELGADDKGVRLLRSYAPIRIEGLSWFLVAEIEGAEAFAPVDALYRRTWQVAAAVAVAVLGAAWWLGRSLTDPLAALAEHAAVLGRGHFTARMPERGPSEAREVASAFNRMADDLQRTTVSRDQLNALNEQLHRLAGQLIEAQEAERRRIAADLHDDVTQQLASVAIELGQIKKRVAGSADSSRDIEAVQARIATLSSFLHDLARQLHPAVLDDLGLAAALEAECGRPRSTGEPDVSLRLTGDLARVGRHAQLVLYRATQEALRNVRHHARASHAWVDLEVAEREATLRVRDDGRGFAREDDRWRPGVGLASMRERARAIGGSATVTSSAGAGTTVTVVVPVEAA